MIVNRDPNFEGMVSLLNIFVYQSYYWFAPCAVIPEDSIVCLKFKSIELF